MTTNPPGRAPFQPQPKAPSTTQSIKPDVIAANGSTNVKAPSKAKSVRARQEPVQSDVASNSATLSLIRRILTPDKTVPQNTHTSPQPIEDILPPLTSSNDVDIQLYAILAIIIKDFVNTWYTKITADHTFVDEVIQIIAHCSRALEQRLRQTDIPELLLDGIPSIIRQHVQACRIAKLQSVQLPYNSGLRDIYHSSNRHPGLDPVPLAIDPATSARQMENEHIYRQLLIQAALAVLLPTEDLQNAPLRLLVSDILADLIVGQAVAGKVCEGWFLHQTISKVISVINQKTQPQVIEQEILDEKKNRLEKFGLLSQENENGKPALAGDQQINSNVWFWKIMQYAYLAFLCIRYLFRGLTQARKIPNRTGSLTPVEPSPKSTQKPHTQRFAPSGDGLSPRPVFGYAIYGLASTLLNMAERMPWLESAIMFSQHVLLSSSIKIGSSNSLLDRFLYCTIQSQVLPPSILPPILLNLRTALFPNNTMGPAAPPPPSAEERIEIKQQAAEAISSLVPPPIVHAYYGTCDTASIIRQIEVDLLEPFDDVYLNKHLVYAILEHVLVKLVPELGKSGVEELLTERGISWPSNTEAEDNLTGLVPAA